MIRHLCLLLLTPTICGTIAIAQEPRNVTDALTGPTQVFEPSHQKPISYVDKSAEATLVVGPDGKSLTILDLSTKEKKTLQLPQELAQVDEIRGGIDERLVVRGMVNGSSSEIIVIDRVEAKLIDKFLCYLPNISPRGDYVAFIKFYPSHFAEGTEDHYMLYDLRKKASDNRPIGIAPDDWQNVGVGLYPIGIGNKPGDNVGVQNGVRHESASGFFWDSDGRELFFADRISSGSEINLVLVDIGSGGMVGVRTAQQDTGQLCSVLEDPKSASSCSLLVRKVEFQMTPTPTFTVTFEIVRLRKLIPLAFSSSRFRPSA